MACNEIAPGVNLLRHEFHGRSSPRSLELIAHHQSGSWSRARTREETLRKGTLHREDGALVAQVIFDEQAMLPQRRETTAARGEIPATKSGRGLYRVVGEHGPELADQARMLLRGEIGNELRIRIIAGPSGVEVGEFRAMSGWSRA